MNKIIKNKEITKLEQKVPEYIIDNIDTVVEQQLACEKLIVDAAIEGSYEKALQGFTMNRTVRSAFQAEQILDDLIEANKKYWPELK